jgi:hypothetical protein
VLGAVFLGLGFVAAGWSPGLAFALAQGVLIGLLGTSSTFSPLVADTTLWFERPRHRGGDLRERQLPRRRAVAADHPALRRGGRLAHHLRRHRRVLRRDDAAAGAAAAATAAGAAGRGHGAGAVRPPLAARASTTRARSACRPVR